MLFMMNLKARRCAACLASPAIRLQHFLTKLLVQFGIQSQAWLLRRRRRPYQGWLSHERLHAFRVVLEIHKAVAVVQLHLKQPKHCKPQKAGNLRPGVARKAFSGVPTADATLI